MTVTEKEVVDAIQSFKEKCAINIDQIICSMVFPLLDESFAPLLQKNKK